MVTKFKVGDKVVKVRGRSSDVLPIGTTAVIGIDPEDSDELVIVGDFAKYGRAENWFRTNFINWELEEVYNSPLYKVMEEK
jgi:hypothetical protein